MTPKRKWTKKKAKRAKKLLALVQKKVAETAIYETPTMMTTEEFSSHYITTPTMRKQRLTAIAQHATKGL